MRAMIIEHMFKCMATWKRINWNLELMECCEVERLVEKMNYYLVDYENVRVDGLKELIGVKAGDAIILFYSDQCKNITLDVMDSMVKLNIQFSCFKVKTGIKNALDFQLASHLGYLVGKAEEVAKYYIVSNDKGFDCLCEYWEKLNVSVERIMFKIQEPQAKVTEKKATQPSEKKSKVKKSDIASLEEIKNVLADADEPDEVLSIFNKYKTKQAICNGMSKHFKDSKRTSAIYKKLKPLLKEKHKS